MLAVQLEISERDRVGVEATVWTARRETLRAARRLADAWEQQLNERSGRSI